MENLTRQNNQERPVDILARYILIVCGILIGCAVAWVFRTVIFYIIGAAIVALIGRPIMNILKKIKIKGRSCPNWILAFFTEMLILVLLCIIITQVIPVVYGIFDTVSQNFQQSSKLISVQNIAKPIQNLNSMLISLFPSLGSDFQLEKVTFDYIKNSLDFSSLSNVLGSVASFVLHIGIGIFSVAFISFFFIKDDKLFRNIIGALIPDRYENQALNAVSSIEHLLSRYFTGLVIEICGVAALNFLGLWAVARLDIGPAFGIAFITGILNVIPYVGPWIGIALGTSLGLVLKLSSVMAVGGTISIGIYIIILVAIFVITQMVDVFVLQPVIYSASIKAEPLEIFIVLLIAGNLGGIVGMLVAIPCYTALRVIASRFLASFKAIRRLMPESVNNQDNITIK